MNDREAILTSIDELRTNMNRRFEKQDGALFGDPSDPKKPGIVMRVDRIEQAQEASEGRIGVRRAWAMALTGGGVAMLAVEIWHWAWGK